MSTEQEFVDRLNTALSWELAGIVQYMHHATMLTGPDRAHFEDFFLEGSREARQHAETVSNKIVVFGGVPTVEPARIRRATEVEDMFEAALTLEEDALDAWEAALDASDVANQGTQFWLEDHISEEQEHVDELRTLTRKVKFGDGDLEDVSSASG
ncbi:MAG: bacterioferritin [Bradymonadaceae bacterium]